MPKPVSVFRQKTKQELQEIINKYSTLAEIIRHFNLHSGAGNYRTLKKVITDYQIDISHIQLGINSNKGKKFKARLSSKDVLVMGKFVSGHLLKKVLYRENLLTEQCAKCGLGPIWQNAPITLTIDHIDGNNKNNLLSNLRILCPNCHSQTSTFSGRNQSKKAISYYCLDCNKEIGGNGKTKRCGSCNCLYRKSIGNFGTKIKWPSNEELIRMVKASNFVQVGKQLGVSDNAVRIRLKRRNLLHLVKS